METVRNYKCPNCGAPLIFGADSGKLHCDSCGNDFDIELMNSLDDEEKNAGSSNTTGLTMSREILTKRKLRTCKIQLS